MALLANSRLSAGAAHPTRWLLVLHGLLGRGSNWRTFTQQLVKAHPSWGGVLVDLRMHGESQGFPPPHTVEAAAVDLDALATSLPGKVEGVLGHSLGGKVALAWAARRPPELRKAFILDTHPGTRPEGRGSEGTRAILSVLRSLPPLFASRQAFVAQVEAAGQPPAMAQWLAMNLKRTEEGLVLAVDLDAMESLFADVLRRDDWATLASPPPGLRFHFVLGGRSTTVDGESRARLEQMAAAGQLGLTVLPESGHWVHVDDPQGTLDAVAAALA
jgi:esterase